MAETTTDAVEALSRQDAKSVREIGHYIKGASANLSLPGLQAASYAIEKAGAESRIEDAKAAFRKWRKIGYKNICRLWLGERTPEQLKGEE